jgi:hypothetical protein
LLEEVVAVRVAVRLVEVVAQAVLGLLQTLLLFQ